MIILPWFLTGIWQDRIREFKMNRIRIRNTDKTKGANTQNRCYDIFIDWISSGFAALSIHSCLTLSLARLTVSPGSITCNKLYEELKNMICWGFIIINNSIKTSQRTLCNRGKIRVFWKNYSIILMSNAGIVKV